MLMALVLRQQRGVERSNKKSYNLLSRSFVNASGVSWGAWYMDMLSRRPYLTKGITGASLKVASDVTGQLLDKGHIYNYRSIKSFAIFGMFMDTPLMHVWYTWLYTQAPKYCGKSKFLQTCFLTLADQIVFNPFYYIFWFVCLGTLNGERTTIEEHVAYLKKVLVPTLLDALRVWPLYTFLSAYFLPEALVMPAGSFAAYLFNTYLKIQSIRRDKSEGRKE